MVEAKREFAWQIVHRQTLDLINSQRTRSNQLKTLGYPYCNNQLKPTRDATEAENEEWLRKLASAWGMELKEEKNNG